MNAKKKQHIDAVSPEESRSMLGDRLNFASSEAYKLLRTNLNFCLPNDKGCRIIGFTSAGPGEGKTTTAINLAYTMAQTGKKVLLLEADLRLPTIAKRLGLAARPGVSNLLIGECQGRDALQRSGLLDNLLVLTAGDTSPNPAELLGSESMTSMLEALSEVFEVIVVDMPPVNVVSDALILSRLLSGIALVVRQDHCTKSELAEAMRQLRFSDAKILGFILTGAHTQQKGYRKKNYYSGHSYGYDKATSEKTEHPAK